jgi:RsiW-degrading membrane proteinase PrsW (M82 family)
MMGKGSPMKWMVGITAFCGMGILGVLTLAMIGAMNTGIAGLVVGMILATLPVPFYVMLALWLDRYEKEPAWMLAAAFLWGATGSVFFSFIFNTVNGAIFGAVGGQTAAQIGGSVISAPFVEELAKGIALFIFFFWKKDEFDNITDGIIYASMVGLGFAMTENISYYGVAFQNGMGGSLVNFVLRGMMSPFAHPLFTSLTGIGLGLARETNNKAVKFAAPVVGLGAAMFLHATWNLSASFGMAFLAAYFLIMVPAFFVILGVAFYSHSRERKIIRANLQAYVQAGILSQADVDALTRVGGRLKAQMAAIKAEGIAGWRREGQFQQAASELAFHNWRKGRGITRGEQTDAAREAEYVELLRSTRGRTALG